MLLDAYPEGAGMTDNDGQLPLHKAAKMCHPLEEVIRMLLDAYPESAGKTDEDGHLPLHLATRCGALVENVIRMLLNAYPSAASFRDNKGQTPGKLSHSDVHPKIHVMLALACAGHPPNRPWTTRTHSILKGIAGALPNSVASAPIDAHVSRVRALLCTLHRHGIPSALVPSIVGKVYVSDFFE